MKFLSVLVCAFASALVGCATEASGTDTDVLIAPEAAEGQDALGASRFLGTYRSVRAAGSAGYVIDELKIRADNKFSIVRFASTDGNVRTARVPAALLNQDSGTWERRALAANRLRLLAHTPSGATDWSSIVKLRGDQMSNKDVFTLPGQWLVCEDGCVRVD